MIYLCIIFMGAVNIFIAFFAYDFHESSAATFICVQCFSNNNVNLVSQHAFPNMSFTTLKCGLCTLFADEKLCHM